MANPHPVQNDLLKAKWLKPEGAEALSRKHVTVRFSKEHYDIISSAPAKAVFVRNVIAAMLDEDYDQAIRLVEDLKRNYESASKPKSKA